MPCELLRGTGHVFFSFPLYVCVCGVCSCVWRSETTMCHSFLFDKVAPRPGSSSNRLYYLVSNSVSASRLPIAGIINIHHYGV